MLVIISSAIHIWLLTRRDGLDFSEALRRGAGSAVAFCIAVIVVWPVTALLFYHVRVRLPPSRALFLR
jgi:palmitoyltransferase ZDHHC9/14/18